MSYWIGIVADGICHPPREEENIMNGKKPN